MHGLAASEGEAGDGWGFNGGRVASAAIADRSGLHMFERGQRGREGGGVCEKSIEGRVVVAKASTARQRTPAVFSGHRLVGRSVLFGGSWRWGGAFIVRRPVGFTLSGAANHLLASSVKNDPPPDVRKRRHVLVRWRRRRRRRRRRWWLPFKSGRRLGRTPPDHERGPFAAVSASINEPSSTVSKSGPSKSSESQ